MTAANFITLFNVRVKNQTSLASSDIVTIISDLIKPQQYIKYDDKIELVKQTIKKTNNYKLQTPMRYRQLIIDLINAYTILKIDIDDFDLLSANRLLDPIMATFQSEYLICDSLMKMIVDDQMMDGR